MTPERWREVERLYHAALEFQAGERTRYLDEVCGGDSDLRSEVESLLAVEQDGGFLEGPPSALIAGAVREKDASAPVERRIGPYRLIREIGRGGMGTVYLAERADGEYRRTVAVKLINPGRNSGAIVRRFRTERQVLADLDHPYIARLLDGGATAEGLPYLVMEHVDGMRIDHWCDNHKLTVRERLTLFRKVCDAVQYAHSKQVVHRDIKPGNILVSADGTPKLLDFGIAKVLDPESFSEPAEVTVGPGPMTPEYASPEQFRGAAGPPLDIYALGLVLYGLLTGQLPYPVSGCDRERIAEVISSEPPQKASDTLRTPATAGAVSGARAETPARLRRMLAGDLDNILLKALDKEPGRRYSSASEFSDDLQRFLENRPVLASPHTLPYRGRKFLKRNRATVAVAAGSAVCIVALALEPWRPIVPVHPDSVVLSDFSNSTGESVFDGTLRQALAFKLGESPFLTLLSDEQMSVTLRMMGRQPNERVTPQLAREICTRNGLKAVVSGLINRLGDTYIVQLEAIGCAGGESLARMGDEAKGRNAVLHTLGKLAVGLRRKLGESLSSVQKFDKPFEATSSSLEALEAYTMARKARRENRISDEIALLKHAIELDPAFAYGYAALSVEYSSRRRAEESAEYGRKAFELRDRVTEREKFYLADKYYGNVTGELPKRIDSAKVWTLTFPRDDLAFANLGTAYGIAGRYEEGLAATVEAIRLNPNSVAPYVNAMGYYAALGRLEQAGRTYDEAARRVAYRHLPVYYYGIAFLRRDTDAMARAVRDALAKEGGEDEIRVEQAMAETYFGRMRNAREFFDRAINAVQLAGDTDSAALSYATRAHVQALFGLRAEARRDALRALELASGRDVLAVAGWALALTGSNARAEAAARELAERYPLNTIVNYFYLPALRANLALSSKQPERAIELLRTALPYDFASSGGSRSMYPVFVRGEALLAARRYDEASAEFQKIVSHPGIVINSPLIPLAHLGLARAYAAAGDAARSQAAYQEFSKLWQNADPDLPVLAEVRKLRIP